MIRLFTGTLALALPAAAVAQDELEPIVIPIKRVPREIVVIGSGLLKTPDSDRVQPSAILLDLDPGFGARIENRLRDEAGIVQFRRSDGRSAHPTSQGVTLRGLGGNASSRALVTLDGVPQADPFGGWVAWSAYDAINLGGIVVTRGGGSGADGPGALAGTIGLHSAMTDGVEASLAYGSRDGWDASASVGGEIGAGQIAVDGRYSRGDGFVPVAEGQRGAADRAAPYEQGGLGVRLRFDAGDNSRIEASVRGFSDERDRARHRFFGDQPRLRKGAVEPVDDRHALDDRFAIDDEHRDKALRILFEKGVAALLARDQADLDAIIVEPLEVQRDADAKAGRGTEIIVEDEIGHKVQRVPI